MTFVIELAWRRLMWALGTVGAKRVGHNNKFTRQLVRNMHR